MKKNALLWLLPAIIMLLLSAGCTHSNINGPLDGTWLIKRIIPNDGEPYSPTGFTISFAEHVCQMRPGPITANMEYNEDAKRIMLHFPYASVEQTLPFGIDNRHPVLEIIRLQKGNLQFTTGYATVYCVKI